MVDLAGQEVKTASYSPAGFSLVMPLLRPAHPSTTFHSPSTHLDSLSTRLVHTFVSHYFLLISHDADTLSSLSWPPISNWWTA
jgi:hypothetical protein